MDYLQGLEDQATAALNTADNTEAMKEYLQDIRDLLAGKPLSYDGSQQPLVPGDKPGAHRYGPPSTGGGTQPADLYIQNPPATNRIRPATRAQVFTTGTGDLQATDITNPIVAELKSLRTGFNDLQRTFQRYGLVRGIPERV